MSYIIYYITYRFISMLLCCCSFTGNYFSTCYTYIQYVLVVYVVIWCWM